MELLVVFFIGACVGSFLNVLADRLPNGESVLFGRSHCDHCKKTLRWYELLPILSWLVLGARCRRCHTALSVQYPLVEMLSGTLAVILWTLYSTNIPYFMVYSVLTAIFVVIFVADFKYQIIPDSMVVIGLAAALVHSFYLNILDQSPLSYGVSAFGAFLFFFLLWYFTKGKGMGFGDVKLVFLMGMLLGFPGIVIALYIAFLTGALVGVILMISRHRKLSSKVAFGPFLIIGTISTLLAGDVLWNLWLGYL